MKKLLLILGAAYFVKTQKPELWEKVKEKLANLLGTKTTSESTKK